MSLITAPVVRTSALTKMLTFSTSGHNYCSAPAFPALFARDALCLLATNLSRSLHSRTEGSFPSGNQPSVLSNWAKA